MAVTSCQFDLKGVTGTLSPRYSDESVQERFTIQLDATSRDLPTILDQCHAINSQFPSRGQAWPLRPTYGLFAKQFQFEPQGDKLKLWHCTVSYMPLDPSEPNTENNDNPLNWPATFEIDWVEYEEAVTQAKNVQAIGVNSGSGQRAANTLGPVVNSALQEFDEGLFVTRRDAVVRITKNISSLNQVVARHVQYANTTNSDTFLGAEARRAKFLGVESSGVQTGNGIEYYTMTTSVQITKTTDAILNNVGWKFWYDDDGTKKLASYKIDEVDDDGDKTGQKIDAGEPGFLDLSGQRSDAPVTITYRHLEEVAYAGLLS